MTTTARLELIAATLAHLEAELQDPPALGALLGVTIPEDWPPGEYDRDAMVFFRDQLLTAGPEAAGWYGWYAVTLKANGTRDTLVASAGFFGPPEQGSVEIGYSVVPSARRQGFATEIVRALLARAFREPSVREVLAHTGDGNEASAGVLLACGFQRVCFDTDRDAARYRCDRATAGPL